HLAQVQPFAAGKALHRQLAGSGGGGICAPRLPLQLVNSGLRLLLVLRLEAAALLVPVRVRPATPNEPRSVSVIGEGHALSLPALEWVQDHVVLHRHASANQLPAVW